MPNETDNIIILSMPQVDVEALPLHLPLADGINNGGYVIPVFYGDCRIKRKQEYSPIDLLVAGLEAKRDDIIINDLVRFYDLRRGKIFSKHSVYINVLNADSVEVYNVAQAMESGSKILFRKLKRNAPLVCKWR